LQGWLSARSRGVEFLSARHSFWGGILALEYALRYQHHLKGLIIST